MIFQMLLHLLTVGIYELHRDEMFYYAMGSHPDWGFASTPPLMGFLSFILKNLFGNHELAIKFLPALAGSMMILLIALSIRELGGGLMALITACCSFLFSSAMLRTCSLFMPVVFEMFFWTLILYFLLRLINRQNPKYWMALGVSFGLAFLNKYSILVMGSAVLIAFLISPHRKLFWSKYLLFGAGIGLLIIMPNLIWQIRHKLAVVTHMHELYQTQLIHVSVGTFLLEQLLANFAALPVWLAGVAGVLFIGREKRIRIFGVFYLLTILLFLLLKVKPYYTLGVYPIMFAVGAYILEKYFRRWIFPVIIFIALNGILNLPFGLPVLPQGSMEKYCSFFAKYVTAAPMRGEQNQTYPLPQDYMDMTGWNELATLVHEAYQGLNETEKKECTIFANNYGQAAAIDFYGSKYKLPPVVCLHDSYIFWAPDSLNSKIFIISDHRLGDIPELFGTYRETGKINNRFFREDGLKVFLCSDPKPALREFFYTRIREQKNLYGF
jgi:hypothetical protein